MKKLFIIIGVAALLATITTACTTQHKATTQRDLYRAAIVETDAGVVLYPSDYVSVTNGSGQVLTYAKYSATPPATPRFSLAGFFGGYGDSLDAFADSASETHTGNGKALLANSQYTQLTSDFTSGARFAGSSQLSVGSIQLEINTNAISATGNAGSQLLSGVGSLAGQFVNKAATGKP